MTIFSSVNMFLLDLKAEDLKMSEKEFESNILKHTTQTQLKLM